MLRTLTHRLVDLAFDVVAELFATLLDLGVLALDLLRRARSRWAGRRAVPSWEALGLDAGTVVDTAMDAGTGGVVVDGEEVSFLDQVLREDREPVTA